MLTALAIDNAKPRDRPYELTDGSGLHLLVMPSGSKLWRFRYRFAGNQLMLSFGAFPEVSLAKARAKRDATPTSASRYATAYWSFANIRRTRTLDRKDRTGGCNVR